MRKSGRCAKLKKKQTRHTTIGSIQQRIFRSQLVLTLSLTLFLSVAGALISLHFETEKQDRSLHSIAATAAQTLAHSGGGTALAVSEQQREYLDFLQQSVEEVDAIAVVSTDLTQVFRTTKSLIGTVYDGTLPDFAQGAQNGYAAWDNGPSGTQRQAYVPIYSENGTYLGFVLSVSLMTNIYRDNIRSLQLFAIVMVTALLIELLISLCMSRRIRHALQGYEPDVFSAMCRLRDNILASLEEGIVATDEHGTIQFTNRAAARMLERQDDSTFLAQTVPVPEDGSTVGAVRILRDRAEYTKLMEDLAGTRHLVDSMRASNHDFTNKLHVILGLIQMGLYEEAEFYIQTITVVQRETISRIMQTIDDPALAALLIGKLSRATELNIRWILHENTRFQKAATAIPGEVLVTIAGNLVENAFEAMNTADFSRPRALRLGLFTHRGELLISVEDTGPGIAVQDQARIFEKGFSTKGVGRGTGLYQVKATVERLGGSITLESQPGKGTSFQIHIGQKEHQADV